jgi:polar amino acid transport system substrate-binding protein
VAGDRRPTAGVPMNTRRATLGLGLVVVLSLSACTSSSTPKPTAVNDVTTTTGAAPPAAPCTDTTTNPVASFAPDPTNLVAGQVLSGSTMAKIKTRGHLIAGVSADTLLFGFRNPFSGQLEGFDIDMVRAVATEIFGKPDISYKVLTYAQRIPALQTGAVDIVADVMTINCKRWESIDFSSEYFQAGQKFLVSTASNARGIGDLNGKRVCAAEGSTNIDELKNYPKVITVPVPDISDCMVLFQQGSVDAVTGDDTVLAGFDAQDPYAKTVGAPLTKEPYGLGIKQHNTDFVRYVNAIIEQMRVDGSWAQMYRKWLKPTGALPAPPRALYGRTP